MISEEKKKIVIENYFKSECNINTTIHDAYVKGFERGLSKAPQPEPVIRRKTGYWVWADGLRCSECGYKLMQTSVPQICPHCGRYNGGGA